MSYTINKKAQVPTCRIEAIPDKYSTGLHIFYSCQCPYTNKAVSDISKIAINEFDLQANVVNLDENNLPKFSPFGTFHILYNGELIAFHPISGTRFKNIMRKVIQ